MKRKTYVHYKWTNHLYYIKDNFNCISLCHFDSKRKALKSYKEALKLLYNYRERMKEGSYE